MMPTVMRGPLAACVLLAACGGDTTGPAIAQTPEVVRIHRVAVEFVPLRRPSGGDWDADRGDPDLSVIVYDDGGQPVLDTRDRVVPDVASIVVPVEWTTDLGPFEPTARFRIDVLDVDGDAVELIAGTELFQIQASDDVTFPPFIVVTGDRNVRVRLDLTWE